MTDDRLKRSLRSALVAEITAAFDGVPLGGGVTLHQARSMDDYEYEWAQLAARSRDAEARWQDVAEDKLRELHDVHPFLDPEGFRFYIPAFMIWVLRHLDDETDEHRGLNCSTIYSFKTGQPSDPWHSDQRERFALLNPQQSRSVCGFLRHLARYDPSSREDAESFLAAYWGRFCPEAATPAPAEQTPARRPGA